MVMIRTVWSLPSSTVTVGMPQSGLAIMRAKERSVTSPQAFIHSTIGLAVSAIAG